MTINMSKAVIFAVGALIGSAVTYLFCKKAEIDKINDLTESYEKEFRELCKTQTADIPEETEKVSSGDPTRVKPDTNKTNYSGYFKPEEAPSIYNPSVSLDSLVRDQSAPDDGGKEGPVIITQEAYDDNPWNYRQVSMLYWPEDDYAQLAESEDQDLIEESGYGHHWKVLGKQNLEAFENSEDQTMWIKSDAYHQLFEVEKMYGPAPIDDIFDGYDD